MGTTATLDLKKIDMTAVAIVLFGRDIKPATNNPTLKFNELVLHRFGEEDELHILVNPDGT